MFHFGGTRVRIRSKENSFPISLNVISHLQNRPKLKQKKSKTSVICTSYFRKRRSESRFDLVKSEKEVLLASKIFLIIQTILQFQFQLSAYAMLLILLPLSLVIFINNR